VKRHSFLVVIDFTDEKDLETATVHLWDACRFVEGVDKTVWVEDISEERVQVDIPVDRKGLDGKG
jgi:hypothetical protein